MKKASTVAAARQRNRAPSNGTDFDTGQLLSALMAFKRGDFSARLPEDWTGVPGKIADTFNAVHRVIMSNAIRSTWRRIALFCSKESSDRRKRP